MANKFKVTDQWGETIEVWASLGKYADGSIKIQLWCDEGPYATLTREIDESYASNNRGYVDVNNCPWAEDLINKNGLGRHTGIFKVGVYCAYPLYEFYLEKF